MEKWIVSIEIDYETRETTQSVVKRLATNRKEGEMNLQKGLENIRMEESMEEVNFAEIIN